MVTTITFSIIQPLLVTSPNRQLVAVGTGQSKTRQFTVYKQLHIQDTDKNIPNSGAECISRLAAHTSQTCEVS